MFSHLPVNHPLRPLYRVLSALVGAYTLVFGIVGFTQTRGTALFAQAHLPWVLGLRTNLAFALLSILGGLILLFGVLVARNVSFLVSLGGGLVFMVVGLLVLGVLRTDANFLGVTVTTCIASFLLAALTFTFGDSLSRRLARNRSPHLARAATIPFWLVSLQLAVAIYGGYFGGGMGIMTLAMLSISGMTNIHEMNGLKTALAAAINGVSLAAFALDGLVAWGPGVLMAAGGVFGGYWGAAIARRIDGFWVRLFVTVVAWGMTSYFFLEG